MPHTKRSCAISRAGHYSLWLQRAPFSIYCPVAIYGTYQKNQMITLLIYSINLNYSFFIKTIPPINIGGFSQQKGQLQVINQTVPSRGRNNQMSNASQWSNPQQIPTVPQINSQQQQQQQQQFQTTSQLAKPPNSLRSRPISAGPSRFVSRDVGCRFGNTINNNNVSTNNSWARGDSLFTANKSTHNVYSVSGDDIQQLEIITRDVPIDSETYRQVKTRSNRM